MVENRALVANQSLRMPWSEWSEHVRAERQRAIDLQRQKEASQAKAAARWGALLTALDQREVTRPPLAREWMIDEDALPLTTNYKGEQVVPYDATQHEMKVSVVWLLEVLGVDDPVPTA
jgi:hypothetical protein